MANRIPVSIAIDAGTTGVRALVVDEQARVVDLAYRELTQHFPRPGRVEHDAAEIWRLVCETLDEVAGRLGDGGRVARAIGITNQRETVVVWDRATGTPLHRALVWQDRRTAETCHALKAEAIGCDAVSVDGFECGGHPGEDDVPNFILLPRAAEELKIPFLASGGMADGRSLVAALALGADGMNMGTRFIATKEAPVHENVKKAIVAASELDTRLVMRPLRNTERVLNNAGVERLLEKERTLGSSIKFEDIFTEVAGVYPRIMKEGDMDAGAWSCGMVAGLIHDIPTVAELINRIMDEAHALITGRLAGMI